MRDNFMGGLLAFAVAAPIVVVCCGGGTAVFAALFGGIGAWLSGMSGIAVLVLAGLTYLIVRALRHLQMKRASGPDPSQRKTAP